MVTVPFTFTTQQKSLDFIVGQSDASLLIAHGWVVDIVAREVCRVSWLVYGSVARRHQPSHSLRQSVTFLLLITSDDMRRVVLFGFLRHISHGVLATVLGLLLDSRGILVATVLILLLELRVLFLVTVLDLLVDMIETFSTGMFLGAGVRG